MKKVTSILCIVQPDENSEAAIIQALRLAEEHQAKLTFTSIIENANNLSGFFKSNAELELAKKKIFEQRESEVKKWISQFQPNETYDFSVCQGIGFVEVVKLVIKNGYDLLIKCADDAEWLSRLFGSEDMHLLRKCPCPVLMLNPKQKNVFKNILATVDVNHDLNQKENEVQDQLNLKVLDFGCLFSIPDLSSLNVGSVWEAVGESFMRNSVFSEAPSKEVDIYVNEIKYQCSKRLESLVDKTTAIVGEDVMQYLDPKLHLVKGYPAKEIPKLVKTQSIDLLVMGTVARTGVPGFIIGNTAESILEQVCCSVLAIKPEGFESPIK
ncbi:universal stress protein [Saccharophagus degradans]|uniref:universal stress protein n=1 Tax=Saccharophagus degradans TaxID=86304 RepID=UPI002477EA03|nr:universal stress protein [Saccharophagus degradans]WGO96558.1 universal stress protein [Saccharophagus degradans]